MNRPAIRAALLACVFSTAAQAQTVTLPSIRLWPGYELSDPAGDLLGSAAAVVTLCPNTTNTGTGYAQVCPGSSASNPLYVSGGGSGGGAASTVNQGTAGTASWLVSDPLLEALISGGSFKVAQQGAITLGAGSAAIGSVALNAPLPAGTNALGSMTVNIGTQATPDVISPASGSTFPVSGSDGAAVTSTATATGQIGAVTDTAGYASISYTLAPATGSAVQFQESTTTAGPWVTVTAYSDPTGVSVGSASATTPGTYRVASGARYQRAIVQTYVSGTVSLTTQPRASAVPATNTVIEPTLDLTIRLNDSVASALFPRVQVHTDGVDNTQLNLALRVNDVVATTAAPRLQVHPDALVAGTANIGRTALPTGTGAAGLVSVTSGTANTLSALFAANAIVNGCMIQNPAASTTSISVDFGGGTVAAPVNRFDLVPGDKIYCPYVPTTAVNVYSITGVSVAFNAGRF